MKHHNASACPLLLAGPLLLTLSFGVQAQLATPVWYAGSHVNWAHATRACEPQATSCDVGAAGFGAFVGAPLTDDWLALQVGYDDLGDIKANYPALKNGAVNAPYQAATQGLEIALKPSWAVNDALSLYAKAGTLGWQMDVSGQEIDMNHNARARGWSPLLGLGSEWALSPQWRVFAEYRWIPGVGGGNIGETTLNVASVGVQYRFAADDAAVAVTALALPSAPPTASTNTKTGAETTASTASSTMVPPQPEAAGWSFSGTPFEFGRAILTPEARDKLTVALVYLRRHPQANLHIVTHADSVGSAQFNQQLSDARAQAVRQYFINRDITPARLHTQGLGECMPIADNHLEIGREKNRRIDLLIGQGEA
ncbi:OmpA family protein [Aeromonas enteropelogenes]|uniref:OmpA family protein n=1 Tax=Aeromonas enteropelogenes TaxID=29489 RepID=UPI003B9E7CBD